jgi:hypothetical protein
MVYSRANSSVTEEKETSGNKTLGAANDRLIGLITRGTYEEIEVASLVRCRICSRKSV